MNIKKSIAQIAGAGALLVLSAGMAHANVLVNPGFEDPGFVGAEAPGPGNGWTPFGDPNQFRIQGQPPIGPAGAFDGTVVLKVFGGVSGVYQDYLGLNPTDVVTGTAYAMNDSLDPMAGAQIAALNLVWLQGGNPIPNVVSFGSTLTASDPQDVWTQIGVVGATVPTGADGVRIEVLTGAFGGAGGGAPRLDGVSLEIQAIPVPAAVWLFGSGLIGLVGLARRRKA